MREEGRLSEYNREDKSDQSTLYASMEISQWNPFVQLIYINFVKRRKSMGNLKFPQSK
jgi:hypothetical protein